jgi:hypothetical protein
MTMDDIWPQRVKTNKQSNTPTSFPKKLIFCCVKHAGTPGCVSSLIFREIGHGASWKKPLCCRCVQLKQLVSLHDSKQKIAHKTRNKAITPGCVSSLIFREIVLARCVNDSGRSLEGGGGGGAVWQS